MSAAAKAGMDEKTARKYRDLGRLPSEVKVEHTWRTRPDPFAEVWEAVAEKLKLAPGHTQISTTDRYCHPPVVIDMASLMQNPASNGEHPMGNVIEKGAKRIA